MRLSYGLGVGRQTDIDAALRPDHNGISSELWIGADMTELEPTVTPTIDRPKAGFNDYAERLNGRAAMVGFVCVVLIELLTGKGLLTWLGLT